MDGRRAGTDSGARLDRDPPLIAGHIHGVRTWSLVWTSDGDLALAGYGGSAWESGGQATHAECLGGTGADCRHPPEHDCGCGLYARHAFTDEARELAFGPPDRSEGASAFEPDAAGVVEAWGKVELHRGGFRAEFARPIALVVLQEWRHSEYAALVGRLARRYRAEVVSLREPDELAAWCERHKLGLAKPTVRSLLRERPRPPSPAEPTPEPAGDRGGTGWLSGLWEEWRPDGIGDALGLLFGGVLMLLYGAFWVAVAYAIAAAIFGWYPEEDRPRGSERSALHGKRSLEIADEEIVRQGKRRWLYLATVENTGDRNAIGVVPTGRLVDRDGERIAAIDRPGKVEGDANLAPGQTGVVWDVIRLRGSGARSRSAVAQVKVTAGARTLVRGGRASPSAVRGVRPDHELCIVTATIDSERRMSQARLSLVARDHDGRLLGATKFGVGPLTRGRGEYFVTRIPPRACTEPPLRLEGYPALTRRQVRAKRHGM